MYKITLSTKGFCPIDLFGKPLSNKSIFLDRNSGYICYGIMNGKENVGNILIWKMNNKTYQIDTIWIKKQYRNKKIGSRALQKVLAKHKNKNFCLSGVKEAKNFYLRNGFEIICFRQDSQCYDFQLIRKK